MAKDDFDINFDFEQELGFDPKSFLGDTEIHDDIDLNEFSDEELGLGDLNAPQEAPQQQESRSDDFDLDMDLGDFLSMGDPKGGRPADENVDVPEFAHRQDYDYDQEAEYPQEEYPEQDDAPQEFQDEEEVEQPKKKRERKPKKPKEPKKPAGPNIFTKFYDLYFAPIMDKSMQEEPVDPERPRRRRRKSKMQIFKEVYLPPIVVSLCLILVLTFTVGSVTNFIKQKKLDADTEKTRLDESISAEQEAERNKQRLLMEAEALAQVYDYDGAIAKLEEVGDLTANTEFAVKRSEYETIRSSLKEYQDPTTIPNLSFHTLMVDPARAFAVTEDGLGGLYNRNFVSIGEFEKILQNIYDAGYVLVDFDSFTTYNNNQIFPGSIKLPEGKKPIMITETMVNYYGYMVDGNDDEEPDAAGHGFASKLVLDANGDIKAEYVDANGTKMVGNYDLVPILEDFLKEHPDFSYQGAKAILAVSGKEGIFGYRINSTYVSTKSQSFVDGEIAGAKEIVKALRDRGYTLACYTYNDSDYKQLNANQINEELSLWTQHITPVIGDVNVFVFAKSSNITDYAGASFTALYNSGFRYFVSNGTTPWAEVNSTYVRQNRLMVTGNSMAWHSDWFKGIFDPNVVIDMTTRVSVPN